MGKLHAALKKADHDRPRAAAPSAPAPSAAPDQSSAASSAPVYVPAAVRGDLDAHLVPVVDPASPAAEAYRALRTELTALAKANTWKSFVVTSAEPGEGKSVSAANLACVLAEEPDRKVVLVDADLRTPALHSLLGMDNQRGLADYLSGGTLLEMTIQRSRLSNLWVLPAGRAPANPAELLSGQRIQDLFSRLCRDYDYVIVDTPAVSSATDAAVVGARTDGALLVVRMGRTQRDAVKSAAALLANAKVRVLGTLLTDV